MQKLDDAHKTLVTGDGYGAGKSAYISPEAAELLRNKAAEWMWLMEEETAAAKKEEKQKLQSLGKLKVPQEFQKDRVVLPAPAKPVAESYCWKPDFEGEDYQSVLHYYEYLPAEHVGSITDPNGYPAKAMSPEAADLYRRHRTFWEAKLAEVKAQTKANAADRQKVAKERVERAAASAGLSKAELKAKLDRLSELAAQDNLQLACDMIAGFDDAWLFEALLAGATLEKEGKLKPGKELKRFKGHAEVIMLMCMAHLPERAAVDESIHRNAEMTIKVDKTNFEILGQLSQRLPKLRPAEIDFGWDFKMPSISVETAGFLALHEGDLYLRCLVSLSEAAAGALAKHEGDLNLDGLKELTEAAANALSQHKGDLRLDELTTLSDGAARALGKHQGTLTLGLVDLPETIAKALAAVKGDLRLCKLKTVTPAAAAALAAHSGELTLGEDDVLGRADFKISAEAAKCLARHNGPLVLEGLKRIEAAAALALSELNYSIKIDDIEEFPDGEPGARLCGKIARCPGNWLSLIGLKRLQPDCAKALAAFKGELKIYVDEWSDDALIALAAYQGRLGIDAKHISDEVGRALGQRGPKSSLVTPSYRAIALTDAAAEALGIYQGELCLMDRIEMSNEAAAHLVKRRSMSLYRSKLKPAIRKVFESAGSWTDSTWTRNT